MSRSLQISTFKSAAEIVRLRNSWIEVYSEDKEATFFLSWAWLSSWVELTKNRMIIGIQDASSLRYVAFMPLSIETSNGNGQRFGKHLVFGSLMADEGSFVCLPEYEEEAIYMFAEFIKKKMQWDTFEIIKLLDSRKDFFLKCFPKSDYIVEHIHSQACPYIILPESWDMYCAKYLSYDLRRHIRRCTKKIENLPGFKITETDKENFSHQIDTLFKLYQMRKGRKSEELLNNFRSIFNACLVNEKLMLRILWQDVNPIAAIAAFIDPIKSLCIAYTIGINDNYKKLSPGTVIFANFIKYSIENRIKLFDFGAGNEKYKYRFGVKDRFNISIKIRKNGILEKIKKIVQSKVKKMAKRIITALG